MKIPELTQNKHSMVEKIKILFNTRILVQYEKKSETNTVIF